MYINQLVTTYPVDSCDYKLFYHTIIIIFGTFQFLKFFIIKS